MPLPSLARSIAIVILFASTAAQAQLPTAADVQKASAHAQKGHAYFDSGRYQKAVQEYEAAFKLEPDPQLQYAIGEAHRLNDADALAIAAYRRYLELAPDGPDAHNAHRHLRELGAEKSGSKGGRATAPVATAPASATASATPKPKPQSRPERKTPSAPPPKPVPIARTPPPSPEPPPTPPPPSLAPAPAASPSAAPDLTAPPPETHARAPLSKRNKWIIIGASAGAAAVVVLGVGLGVGLRPHETVFMEVRP